MQDKNFGQGMVLGFFAATLMFLLLVACCLTLFEKQGAIKNHKGELKVFQGPDGVFRAYYTR